MGMNPRLLKPTASGTSPASIPGLALWLDASAPNALYTTDAGPVEVPAGFQPTDISGCIGWYDSADLSSMKQNSDGSGSVVAGDPVGYWADKGSSAAHVTASGSARPTLAADAFNGRTALVFNGTSTGLSRTNYTGQGGLSGQTRIAVCSHTSTSVAMFSRRAYGVGGDYFLFMNGNARNAVDDSVNFTGFTIGSGNICPPGIYADVYSNSTISFFSSGSGVTPTPNGTLPATTGGTSTTLWIGNNVGANFWWNGPICEYIIFNRTLTRAELARVEAYLAAKWGISGVHAQATATSDPVGYWRDRSGNGRHATQATAGSRPTISATAQNSKRTLAFDGSNDVLLGTGSQALKTGMTVIGAYFTGSVNYSSLFCVGENAAGKRWVSGSSAGATVGLDWYTNATNVAASAANRTGITSFTFNPTANAVGIRMNGTQVLSQASLSPALAAYASDTFVVAGVPGLNEQFLAGRIFELAVYNRVLSAAECRRVERAMGTKWGITLAPQVSNAEAQDWVNRVYANGGTVSQSTANAVNTFCNAIDAANIRDRFYRLNLFCGGVSQTTAGLNAALVPVYRGPSLGGTQYGNTVDTNRGPFVAADYSETAGLNPGAANVSKYLDTGVPANVVAANNTHLGAGLLTAESRTGDRVVMGSLAGANALVITSRVSGESARSACMTRYGTVTDTFGPDVGTGGAVLGAGNIVAAWPTMFRDGAAIGTDATTSANFPNITTIQVFCLNNSGVQQINHTNSRMGWYSIGQTMTAGQVVALNSALAAFYLQMGRS